MKPLVMTEDEALKAIEETKPECLLVEAQRIINGARKTDYGDARENHEKIAEFWSAILGHEVTAEQVVLCMIGVKMARLCHSPEHRDSWVDIAGYVGVKSKMNRGE